MATTFLQVKNRVTTTLASPLVAGALEATVQSGTGPSMPAAFPYDLTIEDEIVTVTNRVGDVLTITRGAQGTAAVTHAAGANVALKVTAKSVMDLNAAVNALENDAALLPGRVGGQTLKGGPSTGEGLTLRGNAIDANSLTTVDGRLLVSPEGTGISLQVINTGTGSAIAMNNLLNLSAAGFIASNAPTLINVIGPSEIAINQRYTIMSHSGAMWLKGGSVPFVLFNIVPAWALDGVKAAGQIFFFAPTLDDGGVAGRTIGMNVRAIVLNPTLGALQPGSVGTVSLITGMDGAPTVDATWNPITLMRFIGMGNPGGTHAVGITDLVGIDVPDTITKPTNVWTIRNLEDRAKMYHRGSIALGGGGAAAVAATSLLHLRDNALDHTSITIDEVAADGPLPTLDNQARVYVKNNKLVIQWNAGGANLWTSIVLNPPGPYPVAGAWVTDVVAP